MQFLTRQFRESKIEITDIPSQIDQVYPKIRLSTSYINVWEI